MPTNTLFGGIDTRSQAELLQERAKQQTEEFERTVPSGLASSQGMYRAGGMLGRIITQKFNPPTLTESAQRQATAVQAAQSRFKSWRDTNKDSTIEDQGLEWKKYLAEELLNVGDANGAQVAMAYAEEQQNRRKADLEYERLQGDVSLNRTRLRSENWDQENKEFLFGRGGIGMVWDRNAAITDNGRSAFINPTNGNAELGDGTSIPLGQWTNHPPQRPGSNSLYDVGIGSSEAKDVRVNRLAVVSTMRGAMRLRRVLEDSVKETGTVNFLSKAGTITNWASDWIDATSAIGRTVGSNRYEQAADRKNLATESEALAYVRANSDVIAGLEDYMPADVRATTRGKERWAAAATQLAYTRGMSLEPGARQLSDNDFKVHLQAVGASTADPEAFRQIMLENIVADYSNFNTRYQGYAPGIRSAIVSDEGMKEYEDTFKQFMSEFGTSFGTAGAPEQGITPGGVIEVDY